MRKLLPMLLLVFVVACAASSAKTFLDQETQYALNAQSVMAYEKDHKADNNADLKAADAYAYKALTDARAANYSADSMKALGLAMTAYNALLTTRGINGYVSRTPGTP